MVSSQADRIAACEDRIIIEMMHSSQCYVCRQEIRSDNGLLCYNCYIELVFQPELLPIMEVMTKVVGEHNHHIGWSIAVEYSYWMNSCR